MKTYKEFNESALDFIEEEDLGLFDEISNWFDGTIKEDATTSGGIDMPDAPPVFNKSKFMGHDCIDVDDTTYTKCIKGKVPFKRWANYVSDEQLRGTMKNMYQRNKKILIRNELTGGMVFLK